MSSASSVASSASAMARAQKAAEKAAEKAAQKAAKEAATAVAKAQKAAERDAIRAHKEYEKHVRAAERDAAKAAKAAMPKRPRGRPRKNPVTGSIASGYIDAPVLTPPPGPGTADITALQTRLATLEAAYADISRQLQSIRANA
jgi:hypothetical protein